MCDPLGARRGCPGRAGPARPWRRGHQQARGHRQVDEEVCGTGGRAGAVELYCDESGCLLGLSAQTSAARPGDGALSQNDSQNPAPISLQGDAGCLVEPSLCKTVSFVRDSLVSTTLPPKKRLSWCERTHGKAWFSFWQKSE